MAGNAKPEYSLLTGTEGRIDVLNYSLYGSNTIGELFDGSIESPRDYSGLFYGGYYFNFYIPKRSDIWMYGVYYSGPNGNTQKPFALYKIEGTIETLIGNFPVDYGWCKVFSNLPAGTYKVKSTNYYTRIEEIYVDDLTFSINKNSEFILENGQLKNSISYTIEDLDLMNGIKLIQKLYKNDVELLETKEFPIPISETRTMNDIV